VMFRGKFVRNGVEGSGLASIYRVFPMPEPGLLVDRHDSGDGPLVIETESQLAPE
jgi:hypothetical protein